MTISPSQGFVFADNLFFDSIYHLNAAGRQLRTQRLIRVLEDALRNKPPAAFREWRGGIATAGA